MKKYFFGRFLIVFIVTCTLTILFASRSFADQIGGLYNTGVNDSGTVLSVGSLDPHYSMTGPNSTAYTLQKYAFWNNAPAGSSWIGPSDGNTSSALAGDYDYILTFDLTGLDPSTAVITGSIMADNQVQIYVNGSDTGITTSDLNHMQSFALNSSNSVFTSGTNTLSFLVSNYLNPYGATTPTGLLISNLHGEASAAVPIPCALWLFCSGLLGLIGIRRKIREV